MPKSEIRKTVHIKGQLSARYELETLSLPGLAFGTREAFLSHIAAGVNKSMTALLDALYMDALINRAKALQTLDANTPVIVKNAN